MAMDEIPRAPITREKSGSTDFSDNYRERMSRFREATVEEARRTHKMNVEANEINKYIDFIQGKQRRPDLPNYRSPFFDNRIAKHRQDHLAQMTDMRPVIDVTSSVAAYDQVAQMIEKLLVYEWKNRDIDLALVTAADIAAVYGTSFLRLDAWKPGSMQATAKGPDQVMPIQPGASIQESSAVLDETWKAIWWIKRKFPFTSAGLEREASDSPFYGSSDRGSTSAPPMGISKVTWERLSPGAKALMIKNRQLTEGAGERFYASLAVQEIWVDDQTVNESRQDVIVRTPYLSLAEQNWHYLVKPGQRLFPRKRQVVFAGSGRPPLSDGPSPYFHGLYPYATLRFNPVFWGFWGLSKYRDLIPLQSGINEIISGILDLVKRAVNPVVISQDGGIQPAVWNKYMPDMTGIKLRVPKLTPLNDAMKYMEPPAIPAWVLNLLQTLFQEFDRATGSVDVAAMGKKKQAPGGDSIEQMRDSLQTGARLEERMIELLLRDAGRIAVSNILQFYSAPQRLRLLGDGGLTDFDFNLGLGTALPEDPEEMKEFWTKFGLTIGAGSLHSGAKDRDKQVAITLAQRGLLPIQDMLQKIEVPDPAGTFKRLLEEKKSMAQIGGHPPGGGRASSDKMTRGQRNGKAT
jgi:hypothetical protein